MRDSWETATAAKIRVRVGRMRETVALLLAAAGIVLLSRGTAPAAPALSATAAAADDGAAAAANLTVLFSVGGTELWSASLGGGAAARLVSGDCFTGDLKVDQAAGYALWSCPADGTIRALDLASRATATVVVGARGAMGIALDEQTRTVYWADRAARALRGRPSTRCCLLYTSPSPRDRG